jgi:hypothetical protein
LTGTKSFNINSSGEFSFLRYESPAEIKEETINITPDVLSEIRSIAHEILQEFMVTQNFTKWPEHKETFSVAITQEKVTKSISTRRFSNNVVKLKNLLTELLK